MPDDATPFPLDGFGDEFDLLEAELGRLARELTDDDLEVTGPPPDLWASIEARIAVGSTGRPTAVPVPERPGRPAPVDPARVPSADHATTAGALESSVANNGPGVVDLSAHRSQRARRSPAPLLAAAAVALIAAAGAYLLVRDRGGDQGVLLAQAAIGNDDLPVTLDASGSAAVRETNGDLYLQLDLPELPSVASEDAFYEVWMIDTDVVGMVALGVVSPDGRVDLPDDLDYTRFPIVDISVEPLDGNPTHSGQSVLRGVLSDPGTT